MIVEDLVPAVTLQWAGRARGKRSRPRGAGPPRFSPTRLYCEPWQGHSNHCDVEQLGTRQPRWGQVCHSATRPTRIPFNTAAEYTFSALGSLSMGYSVTHMRPSGT